MIRLMVASPASGHGKTVVTCALLAALRRRGLRPRPFKCGPDYIDPMFHRVAAGAEGRNIDLFLSDAGRARKLYAHAVRGYGAAVCEAAMGFYDGLGGVTDAASAWRTAQVLDLPVLLTLRAKGAGLSLAAVIRGMRDFRPDSHIVAVLLNDSPPGFAPALERETGLPVIGCLPHTPEAEISSRHLGLQAPEEVADLGKRFPILAETLEANADLSRLFSICDGAIPDASETPRLPSDAPIAVASDAASAPIAVASDAASAPTAQASDAAPVRIAVARDAAFRFAYAETLETLRDCGAELAFFSPLTDAAPPHGVAALYLPGGYPELYARTLAENASMRSAIAAAVRDGMPTVAECGGFLYLCKTLQDASGAIFPMAGALPGDAFPCGKSVRFGYATLLPDADSMLFRAGESAPVHEFHHWDTTDNGDALRMEKPVTGRSWRCGFANDTLYAAFPHLYFAGRPELARRFVDAARRYRERNPPEITPSGASA